MDNQNQEFNSEPEKNNGASFVSRHATPLSVLVGCVLISASILYSAKVVFKLLSPLKMSSGDQVSYPTANTGPAVAGQQTGPEALPKAAVENRNDAPTLGKQDAPVTILEFSDFQCPYCQQFFNATLGQIKQNYIDTGKAKLVYLHFPLPFHQNAQKAAEAAECASRQNKFFEYHDVLFTKGKADGSGLNINDLKAYANKLGLNEKQFNACLDNGEAAGIVSQDSQDGQSAGVSGTPTFVVNGKLLVGAQPYASFSKAIDEALAQ